MTSAQSRRPFRTNFAPTDTYLCIITGEENHWGEGKILQLIAKERAFIFFPTFFQVRLFPRTCTAYYSLSWPAVVAYSSIRTPALDRNGIL